MRPDRSDAHLPPEEAAKIEQEARRYFEALAPKRRPKPSRSDYSDDDDGDNNDLHDDRDLIPPELQTLQHLQSDPQKKLIICGGAAAAAAAEAEEEYVETEYYKDLNCIDKQHHTTGTGFIRVEGSSADVGGGIDLRSVNGGGHAHHRSSSYGKGNPATNDWIPSADPVIPVSNKPSRSDI